MIRGAVVFGLLMVSVCGYALSARAAAGGTTPDQSACGGSWSISGYQAIYSSPAQFSGDRVTFFNRALKEVKEEIAHPVYYVPGGTLGITLCPGHHGDVLDIEVAVNRETGTRLYAVGDASRSP